MNTEIKLPIPPKPDTRHFDIERTTDVWSHSQAQMLAYARAAVAADRAQREPNWRHPKVQALIGSDARKCIQIDLMWRILEDPNQEFTASDMEYWDTIHDKLKEALSTKPAAQGEPIESVWLFKNPDDGRWMHFVHEQHRLDTIADGRWEVARFELVERAAQQKGARKPGIDDTDVYTADQLRAAVEADRAARKPLVRADYENHSEYLGCTSVVMRHGFESGIRFAERHHGITED